MFLFQTKLFLWIENKTTVYIVIKSTRMIIFQLFSLRLIFYLRHLCLLIWFFQRLNLLFVWPIEIIFGITRFLTPWILLFFWVFKWSILITIFKILNHHEIYIIFLFFHLNTQYFSSYQHTSPPQSQNNASSMPHEDKIPKLMR